MGKAVEIDNEFKLYLDNREYIKIVKGNFWYIFRKKDYEMFMSGSYPMLLGEMWNFSHYVLNIIADKFAVMEKNRWGKQDFWMLADNIKFGKIICKLTRR